MKRIVFFLFIFLTSVVFSQRSKNFSLQVSGGPNIYFNNLELYHDNVDVLNYSLYSKITWNTKYRLSFGIEAGYVRLYRVNDFSFATNAEITMTAIPIQAVIQMKVYKQFYVAGTFGPSFIRNNITSLSGDQNTHSFSIADISLAIGYKRTFKNNLYLGTEIKHYYSSKAEDRNLSVPLIFGINF